MKDVTYDYHHCFHFVELFSLKSDFLFTVHRATGLKAGSALVNEDDQQFAQRNAAADLIRNLLEGLRPVVINGNDVLPPLDPLQVPTLGPIQVSTTG